MDKATLWKYEGRGSLEGVVVTNVVKDEGIFYCRRYSILLGRPGVRSTWVEWCTVPVHYFFY